MSDYTAGKRCHKCGHAKPLDEFHRDRTRRDGRYPHCKTCRLHPRPASRSYYAAHARLRYHLMPPIAGLTCLCGEPARHWAYNHLDPDELRAPWGSPYSFDPAYYFPACIRCHRRFDAAYRAITRDLDPGADEWAAA